LALFGIVLAASGALLAGQKAADPALFTIGTPDGSAAEFGLIKERWPGYAKVFPKPIVFTVGKSAVRDWPHIHPSTRDGWAGGKPHTFTINFTAAQNVPQPLFLIVGVLSIWEPSQIAIGVNGQAVASQRLPNEPCIHGIADNPAGERGDTLPLVFALPDGAVKPGENTIGITLDQGSWIIYDYVTLTAKREPPAVQAESSDWIEQAKTGPMSGVDDIVFAVRTILHEHWYANFGYFSPDENRKAYGKGGRLCKLNLKTNALTTLLDDAEGAVRDPCVDYDGKRIVFSYRKAKTETYHLYEIQADGTGLRQLTDGIYDDFEPSCLPDGGIVFVSARGKRWVNCWLTQVANIYRCDADGKNVRPLSANLEHDNTPWPLADGRVLYMRWEYVDRSQVHYHHLWTMNPDGTGQTVYFGNLHPGGVYIDAKPIPGSEKVVMINSPGHGQTEHMGAVAVVSPDLGPDNLASLRNVSRGGDFRDPWAFSENAFLAARNNELVLMNGRGATHTLYRLPKEFGNVWLHEPRPVVKREREPVIPSRVDLAKPTGRYFVDDVYAGRNMEGIQRGDIKKLLVIESLPKPVNFTGGMDPMSYKGTFSLERVLGTAPVEADGSAYFEAPALRSLLFVALDQNGLAVKRMQSFTTVAPGETLGCVGCHEHRATARPAALVRRPQALERAPSHLEAVAGAPEIPDFPRDVQPVLDKHCVRCHSPEKPDGNVVLSGDRGPMFSLSYYTLTAWRQIADGRNEARSNYKPRALGSGGSPLMKMLDKTHYDVQVSPQERAVIWAWLEIGAPYPGTYASLGTGMIGGYQHNAQVLENDEKWPETKAAKAVLASRCDTCHSQKFKPLPHSLSDEIGLSFWEPNMNDPRLKHSRHVIFNLTRPEVSRILLAPLAKAAGGYGLCRAKDAAPGTGAVLPDKNDAGYKTLLAMVDAGKRRLDEIKRFDMPGFRPRPEWVREMKRYGVLPAAFDLAKDPIDVYAVERQYWESLWHKGAAQ
jgi:hypothetical protein